MAVLLTQKIDALSLRFKNNFRERFPEWITSLCLIAWGLIVAMGDSVHWDLGYFNALENLANRHIWGTIAIVVGILRIIALGINGALRPTAHMRALGALVGVLIWSAVIMSYLTLDYVVPAVASKSALLIFDLAALWFAAGDAKVADVKAHALNGHKPVVTV